MAFSLRQLRYFVTVAELGSVSAAAVTMAISQSTVTEALRDLEYDVGCPLLERHARGVDLTQKGQHFLRHALRILADVAAARNLAVNDEPQLAGNLVLGVTQLVAGYVLPELLAQFRRGFPGVQLEMLEENADHLEHMLVGGEVDVAVVVRAPGALPAALGGRAMAISAQHVWLPAGHPAAQRNQISLAELAEEPHILLTIDEIETHLQKAWQRLRIRPKVAFRTASVEALRSLVAAGHGVAVLPELIYRPWSLDGDKVETRALVEDMPTSDVVVIWRRGGTQKAEIQSFIEMATNWRKTRNGGRDRPRPASW